MILKFRNNKRAISPVVATALLLVVAVISVVGFSSWITEFNENLLVVVDGDSSNYGSSVRVEGLINDKLYINSKNKDLLEINSLKIFDNSGVEICSLLENNKDVADMTSLKIISEWSFDDKTGSFDGILEDSVGSYDGNLNGATKLLLNFDGGVVKDLSGYNNSVELYGDYDCGVAGVPGSSVVDGFSNGCDFSKNNSWLEVNFSSDDLDLKKFTISTWFKPSSSNVSNLPSIIEGDGQSPRIILGDAGENVRVNIQVLNSSYSWSGVDLLVNKSEFVDEWFNAVAVFSGNNFKFYINGEFIGEDNYVGNLKDFSFLKFSQRDYIQEFNGTIDEVAIYEKSLSVGEVKELYVLKTNKVYEIYDDKLNFNDDTLEGAVFPNFLEGESEFTLLLNVDSYVRDSNESLLALVGSSPSNTVTHVNNFISRYDSKLNLLGIDYSLDNSSEVISFINSSEQNIGCFAYVWSCRNFTNYNDLFKGGHRLYTFGNDNFFGSNFVFLSNDTVYTSSNYGFYQVNQYHPITRDTVSFQPSGLDSRRGTLSIFPEAVTLGFDTDNNFYETIYYEDIFGSRWFHNQAVYGGIANIEINAFEFVYRNSFLSGGELINLYEFNGEVFGFLNHEKVSFKFTDKITQIGLSLKSNVLTLIINGRIVSNSTISSFDNNLEDFINLGPDSVGFESMVLYNESLSSNEILNVFESNLIDLSYGISNIDLDICDLNKDESYNVVLVSESGLSDISIISR